MLHPHPWIPSSVSTLMRPRGRLPKFAMNVWIAVIFISNYLVLYSTDFMCIVKKLMIHVFSEFGLIQYKTDYGLYVESARKERTLTDKHPVEKPTIAMFLRIRRFLFL